MQTTTKETTQSSQAIWYRELSAQFETLMKGKKLSEDEKQEIKVFILQIARDQYMAGNRSGIRWAREIS